MITCINCSAKLFTISQMVNVKNLGFSLFGSCPKCNTRQPASELWSKKKTIFLKPEDLKFETRGRKKKLVTV